MQNTDTKVKSDPIPAQELELEQYGVWVKAEPQDVIDEPAIDREILDVSSSGSSDAVLLSEEEEDILESFDIPEEIAEGLEDIEALSPPDEFDSGLELPEEPGESFDLEPMEPLSSPEPLLKELDDSILDETIIDVALDDLDYQDTSSEPGVSRTEKSGQSSADGQSYATTEINIEDFGFSDDASMSDVPSLEDVGSIDSTAERAAPSGQPASSNDDFETLDIDLQFDDTIPTVDTTEATDTFGGRADDGLDSSSGFESIDIDSIGLETPDRKRAA